jgi:hypothetical protein
MIVIEPLASKTPPSHLATNRTTPTTPSHPVHNLSMGNPHRHIILQAHRRALSQIVYYVAALPHNIVKITVTQGEGPARHNANNLQVLKYLHFHLHAHMPSHSSSGRAYSHLTLTVSCCMRNA